MDLDLDPTLRMLDEAARTGGADTHQDGMAIIWDADNAAGVQTMSQSAEEAGCAYTTLNFRREGTTQFYVTGTASQLRDFALSVRARVDAHCAG